MQGSYVVSQSPIPPMGSTAAMASKCPENANRCAGNLDVPSEGPDDLDALTEDCPPPPGRKIFVRKATRELTLALAKCTETGFMLNTKEVLNLMDSEDPAVDGRYMDSYGDLVGFGLHDAIAIARMDIYFLATFGTLGKGGAHDLHRFIRDKILKPLHILDVVPGKTPTVLEMDPPISLERIQNW